MLDFMKVSQIAALSLGIIFAVISIATTLLAIKYAKRLNSFAKASALSLLAPFISCISWMYLILSFIEGLRKNEILALVIAIILTIFIFGMIVIVAKALYSKHGADFDATDELKDELAEENVEEQNVVETENVTAIPLLLENNDENVVELEEEAVEEISEEEINDTEVETFVSDEEIVEENIESEEEISEVEENDIAEEENQETEEENIEESTDEQIEVEESEESTEETVEENAEEVVESSENEEIEESEENENVDENIESEETIEETENNEIEEESVEETEESENNEDFDEEFDKFIEELKKKIDSNDEDDNK